jgi:SSS family solute:Na+ symporter
MVGSTGEAYRVGIGTYGKMASWSGLIHSACFFFVGLPLWALGKRHGYTTQIEYFRDRFESRAIGYILFPILAGLVIPYLLVGLLGAGSLLKAVTVGALPELFPETKGAIPPALTSAVISAVVLTYVCRGGVRSAAWANTFQTLVFIAMGLMAFVIISIKLGGPAAASEMADPAKMVREGQISGILFFSYCFIPLSVGMFPHLFQHWLTARSARTFNLTVIAHPLCIMLTWVPCILIGVWATGAVIDGRPVVPPGVSPNAVLGIMVGKLTNPAIAGFVSAGVLAAIMSSLDSQFVCLGTMFTKDVVLHACGKNRFTDRQEVWIARGFISFVVLVTFLLSLSNPVQIFSLGVWCFSGFAALFPVVFASLYWRRVTRTGAISAILVTAVVWLFLFRASGFGADRGFLVFGAMPVGLIFAACAVSLIVVSLFTAPPSDATLKRFFCDRGVE